MPRRMPRSTRALLTILLLALSSLWSAAPATAGGPTSVLVSVPGEGRLTALSYSDPGYRALEDLVGLGDPAGAAGESKRSHESAEVVTLTWLVHDVQVWRVDRVHLGAADGPWVETRQVVDERAVWDAEAVWHQADRRLTTLLARVLPEPGTGSSGDASALDLAPYLNLDADAVPAADDTAADDAAGAAADDPGPAPLPPLAWSVAGVLVGALAAAGGMRHLQRRRPAPADDRRPTADQLAWP